jgi:hypothetical protein
MKVKTCLLILVSVLLAINAFAADTSKQQTIPSEKPDGVITEGNLLWEGFESGVVPPPGWNLIKSGSPWTWEIDTYNPYEGWYIASCFYDEYLNPQDEVLISPTFTGSGMVLEFYLMGSLYWGCGQPYDNYDIALWVVIGDWDGGSGDDILITEDAMEDFLTETWVWTYCTYDLPSSVDGIPIRIAFEYTGRDGALASLDAISVEGEAVETGDIHVLVTDIETSAPIPKAIIIAKQGEKRVIKVTDKNGFCEIPDLQAGWWMLICFKQGYKFGIKLAKVKPDDITYVEFPLAPKE